MAHNINAFIAKTKVFEGSIPYKCAKLIGLDGEFSMLLPTKDFLDEIHLVFNQADKGQFEEFYYLRGGLVRVGEKISMNGPIAYVETEYFGGAGSQAAIVWNKGKVVLGPLLDDPERPELAKLFNRADGPIDQALRLLGVVVREAFDEFDEIGLGRYRSNESWVGGEGEDG